MKSIRGWRLAALIVLGLGVVAQVIPIPRSNPPVEEEVPAPQAVREVLRRSCYNCHSHETRWPWYAYVAPVSWLVVYDVTEGREHLDFSAWNRYDAKRRKKKLEHVWEEVDEGDMPLPIYLVMHPDARLSDADRELLHAWTGAD